MTRWEDAIEADLHWREEELSALKLQLTLSDHGSVRERALLRAMCTMLYAHYEGFCKFAWDLFLEQVERLGIKRSSCGQALALFSLEKEFHNLRHNTSSNELWQFATERFPKLLEEELKFEVRLETDSNLWPNVLKRNCVRVALNCVTIDEHETRLKALVSRRNDIAHGRLMVIRDIREYKEFEDAALIVMHELAVSIVETLDELKCVKLTAAKGALE